MLLIPALSCGEASISTDQPTRSPDMDDETASRTPRMALWLAKKDELITRESAAYDLVMTSWFEPSEADAIR
ncbi:MAG: hypothetical protein AB8I69_10190, partial [Anaerolineae bacterium]